jgi:myo-inositol-1-phosphate synthase
MTPGPCGPPARARTGLWLVGARGSVATTAIVGLLALQAGLVEPIGCVTEHPPLAGLALPDWRDLVVGGHDIVDMPLDKRAELLAEGGVFPHWLLGGVRDELRALEAELRPGYHPASHRGPQIQAVRRLAGDLCCFRERHDLSRVVVVNVSSTEPPVPAQPEHADLDALEKALSDPVAAVLPPSALAAYAALQAGCCFVDFTPSMGARLPALVQLAQQRGLPLAGSDGKTGETLVKSVLAPMFTDRALRVRSWAATNLLGGGDGATLHDPGSASSKLASKARTISTLLGDGVIAPLHIDNVPDLGDWKTAWDHISFTGFLGARMTLQFTWTGCDSALAAPLVLDLARLTAAGHAAGYGGPIPALAFFFKDPMTDGEPVPHGLAEQTAALHRWVAALPQADW